MAMMAQIIKSVCVCQCVCLSVYLSVCEHSHGRISLSIFTKIRTDLSTPKGRTSLLGGQYRSNPSHILPQKTHYPHFRPKGPENPCMRIAKMFASQRKSRSKNTMMMSDFTPEVEIQPFRACAMKNMQYNPYLCPNCRNCRVLKKIGVEERDGDVRF